MSIEKISDFWYAADNNDDDQYGVITWYKISRMQYITVWEQYV